MPRRAAGALILWLVALPVGAQTPEVDPSLFRPASGGDGTVGVEGARPLPEGTEPIELQLLLDGAFNPVRPPPPRIDRRLGGWIGWTRIRDLTDWQAGVSRDLTDLSGAASRRRNPVSSTIADCNLIGSLESSRILARMGSPLEPKLPQRNSIFSGQAMSSECSATNTLPLLSRKQASSMGNARAS